MSPATETPTTKETTIPAELAIMHAARRLKLSRDVLRGVMIGLGVKTRPGDYGHAKLIAREDFLRMSEALQQYRANKKTRATRATKVSA